jgi:hypothetical protein
MSKEKSPEEKVKDSFKGSKGWIIIVNGKEVLRT